MSDERRGDILPPLATEDRDEAGSRRAVGIGKSLRRIEDRRFITGNGRYVDDITLQGQVFAAVVRSSEAHARLAGIDVSGALQVSGVLCVLTGADVTADGLRGFTASAMPEDFGAPAGFRTFRSILAVDRVRFAGEAVALVVAESAAAAEDGAEHVDVQLEPLSPVVTVEDAVATDAVSIHEGNAKGNVAWELAFGDESAAAAAFASAAHIVELRLENQRLTANAIEPRAAIGDFDSASSTYTLYTSTQNPHGARQQVASVLGVPETKLRVIGPDVGGGFGMKSDAYPEDALVCWASRRLSRPVKWIANRSESLLSDTCGRDQVVLGALAFDDAGRMLGLRASALHAVGAYLAPAGLVPSIFSLRFIPGAYDIQAVHVSTRGVFTTTSPLGPYRGAGRPEATYLIERLIDEAAVVLGVDPAEFRRRNLIPPDELPYTTATHYVYDSGDFPRILEECLVLADWAGFEERREESRALGRLRGRGVAFYIEQGGVFNDRMELRFDPSGGVTIVAGTFSHGQGHETTYSQLVAEWLGVPLDSIRFIQGDTDKVAFGRGTYAARSSMIGGNALRRAADGIIERARPMAALLMEASADDVAFSDGTFRVAGMTAGLSMAEVAKAFYHPVGITDRFGVGLEATGTWSTTPENFPNGCHACEVVVDPETGEVIVARYTIVDDSGILINPMICEGQVHGGLAQGLGQALLEHAIYDRSSGQLLTGTLESYGMPRAGFMPPLKSKFVEIPATTNPLGVKGVGEGATIGAPPTVINAVLDALRPLGVRHIDMPATPRRVWEAIERAGSVQ